MIYRSNLTAPDLQPYFEPLICKPRHNTMGHDALSDPDFEPDCQFFTHDEAAILYNVAAKVQGRWVDIGSRTGWTSGHIKGAFCAVDCVDPIYQNADAAGRFARNIGNANFIKAFWMTAFEYFTNNLDAYHGACIDGNHDSPFPLVDATLCVAHGARVIVFHDFWGLPIREAVVWLLNNGFRARVYNTPNGVAVCWRGEFTPPEHTPDASIDWAQVRRTRAPEFDFGRCE